MFYFLLFSEVCFVFIQAHVAFYWLNIMLAVSPGCQRTAIFLVKSAKSCFVICNYFFVAFLQQTQKIEWND